MIVECACCGNKGQLRSRGWIRACYDRWMRAGKPEEGPPAPGYLVNREEYAWFRYTLNVSVKRAAELAGISERTGWRYEKRLKQRNSR